MDNLSMDFEDLISQLFALHRVITLPEQGDQEF